MHSVLTNWQPVRKGKKRKEYGVFG